MIIGKRPFQDRRYDNPTTTEIAAVYVGIDGALPSPVDRDLEIYPADNNANNTVKIKVTSPNADPMTYPLLFFHGDFDWSVDIQQNALPNERCSSIPRHFPYTMLVCFNFISIIAVYCFHSQIVLVTKTQL